MPRRPCCPSGVHFLPSRCVTVLSFSSRLFVATRSGSWAQSAAIKAYLCQRLYRLNILLQCVGATQHGGRQEKSSSRFLWFSRPFVSSRRDEKQIESVNEEVRETSVGWRERGGRRQ